MAATILEARAVIYGDDRTGPAFAAIEKKIATLRKSAGAIDKVAKSMDRLASSKMVRGLSNFGDPLDKIAGNEMVAKLSRFSREADLAASKVSKLSQAWHAIGRTGAQTFARLAPWLDGAAGVGALHATHVAIKAGADYQLERAKLRVAGIEGKELDAADRQTMALAARYPNLSRVDLLQAYKEVRSVAGKPEEVPDLMPTVAASYSSLKSAGLPTESMADLYKTAETFGLTRDSEQFKRFMNSFVAMQQYAGQTITPETMRRFSQQMQASAAVASPEFLGGIGMLLAQEVGSRGGAGLADTFKEVVAGHLQGKAAAEWKKLGFLTDADVLYSKSGEVRGLRPGHHIKDWQLAGSNPGLFVWDKLLPAMLAHGDKTLLEQISRSSALFENQRGASDIAKLIQQESQFKQHLENLQHVKGNAGADEMGETFSVSLGALTTKLRDFGGVLTSPALTDAGYALSALAKGIGGFAATLDGFNKDHPLFAKGESWGALAGGVGAAGFFSAKFLSTMSGGFGLKGSALALDESAAALSAAAGKLTGNSAASTVADAAKKGGPLAFLAGAPGIALGSAAIASAALFEYVHNLPAWKEGTPGPHGKYCRASGLNLPGGGTYDYTLGSRGNFQEYGTHIAPYSSGFHEFSNDQGRHFAPTPLGHADAGSLKGGIEGPITAQLEGSVSIDVGGHFEMSPEASEFFRFVKTVKAESSSQQLKLNTGRSMPEAAPFSRRQ